MLVKFNKKCHALHLKRRTPCTRNKVKWTAGEKALRGWLCVPQGLRRSFHGTCVMINSLPRLSYALAREPQIFLKLHWRQHQYKTFPAILSSPFVCKGCGTELGPSGVMWIKASTVALCAAVPRSRNSTVTLLEVPTQMQFELQPQVEALRMQPKL